MISSYLGFAQKSYARWLNDQIDQQLFDVGAEMVFSRDNRFSRESGHILKLEVTWKNQRVSIQPHRSE